jgi:hypothetical protein
VGNAHHTGKDLCYLDAENVQISEGRLADLEVCSRDDEKLGGIDGILIEPSARRVRYFVLKSSGWFRDNRYLVPVEDLAHVERDQNVLRLEARASELPRWAYVPGAVRPFTDEDVVTVMFAPHAAA